MRGARHDAADAHRPRLDRVERVADVVLLGLTGAEAADVQEPVVDGQNDVGDQRRHGSEGLEHLRQLVGVGRLSRDRDHLGRSEAVAVAVPQPHRGRQVLGADDDADEAVLLGRVVRGTQLERHLVLRAEVDLLQVLAGAQVEEVDAVAVLLPEQQLADDPVLDHGRGAPLARHEDVVVEVPPEVVGEVLRTAVLLPRADDLEGVVVQQRDAAGPLIAERRTQIGDVDALGAAVRGVRPAVAGLALVLLRLDDLRDLRVERVVLDVDEVDAAGAQPHHQQVAALDVRMRVVGAQRRAARVPAVVVQLVPGVRHRAPADHLPVPGGRGVDVDDGQCVRLRLALTSPEGGDVGQPLRSGLCRQAGRGVEGGIGLPTRPRHVHSQGVVADVTSQSRRYGLTEAASLASGTCACQWAGGRPRWCAARTPVAVPPRDTATSVRSATPAAALQILYGTGTAGSLRCPVRPRSQRI